MRAHMLLGVRLANRMHKEVTFAEVRPTQFDDETVVIVGGGFSGILMAINLVRHDGPSAILVERASQPGRGLAYSTHHPGHLLNVRAANMSALPDQPNHFVEWLRARSWPDSSPFVPRKIYGDYLTDLLDETMRSHPGRLTVKKGEAVKIEQGKKIKISLRNKAGVEGDKLVLALGNLPPFLPDSLDLEKVGKYYLNDPWSPDLGTDFDPNDHVLIIGTGLTMVDVVLALESKGHQGRITAISRRGLMPRVHDNDPARWPPLTDRPSGELSSLLRAVRDRSQTIGWRAAVDELRPFTQAMWLAASDEQKRRFLRHLRPWWDVHRHRLAPQVGKRVDELVASGRLDIGAGKTMHFEACDDGVAVNWRPRGTDEIRQLRVDRIINCTGPQSDLARTHDPLLLDLIEQGLARQDRLGLGLTVDGQGRLPAQDRIFAIGPMTRSKFWEIIAVPDIRKQVWNLARRLSNAHWVEGGGL